MTGVSTAGSSGTGEGRTEGALGGAGSSTTQEVRGERTVRGGGGQEPAEEEEEEGDARCGAAGGKAQKTRVATAAGVKAVEEKNDVRDVRGKMGKRERAEGLSGERASKRDRPTVPAQFRPVRPPPARWATARFTQDDETNPSVLQLRSYALSLIGNIAAPALTLQLQLIHSGSPLGSH